jgi:hypothetical protein
VTNATATRKTAARRALEAPHRGEFTLSMERRMGKGIMPKGLPALIFWFRERCNEEIPDKVHKSGIWRDWGSDATGGSALGSPNFYDEFRRLIEGVPWQTDPDAYYAFPLRAALAQLHRGKPIVALHLFRLALCDGDWRRHADNVNKGSRDPRWSYEEMELFIERALERLWLGYAEMPIRIGGVAAA